MAYEASDATQNTLHEANHARVFFYLSGECHFHGGNSGYGNEPDIHQWELMTASYARRLPRSAPT